LSWLRRLWVEESRRYIYSPLHPNQIHKNKKIQPVELNPNETYLSIFLQSISIPYVRRGTGRYFGAVHSFISIPHLSGKKAEFNMFIAPESLRNIDNSHIDRVITGENRLLGYIPYRGGDIEIELGLFSIKSSDLVVPFLKVLENMASVAGVNSVNVAMPFVKPILDGVNQLAGAANAVLEIGISETLHRPTTGYFVIMQAERENIDISRLNLENDGKLYDLNGPVRYPYMIFNIDASFERPDWYMLPEISGAYDRIVEAIRGRDITKTKEAFTNFKIMTKTSYDLLDKHSNKLIEKVNSELADLLPVTATSMESELNLKPLKEIDLYK